MRERRIALLLLAPALLLLACGLPALGAGGPSTSATSIDAPVAAPASASVRLGYFYKPPDERNTAGDLARRAGFIILTKKDEGFRDAVRAAGYSGKVLQYVLSAEVFGPPGALSADAPCSPDAPPWHNQVAYQPGDFCRLLHPHEDWFLHNGRGERLYTPLSGSWFYHMNPASPGWRQFFIERLRRFLDGDSVTPALGYDGAFLDNVELSLDKVYRDLHNSDQAVLEFADDEAYRAAWQRFLAEVDHAFRPRWPIWANLIAGGEDHQSWEPYLAYLDGGMNESFATGWPDAPLSAEHWDADLRQAEAVLAMGKGYLGVAQGGDSDDLQPFALASYLLITDGRESYFRYLRRSDHRYLRPYENERVAPGAPLAPRYRQPDGTWRRDFSDGFVTVDPATRRARIVIAPEGG